jgi:predicted GNAT family acetyltransferase
MTAPTDVTPAIADNVDRRRYELTLDGEVVGHLSYRRSEGQIYFASTVVQPSHRGRGLAAQLVEHAIEDARREGREVSTGCWYVQDWLDAHPAA